MLIDSNLAYYFAYGDPSGLTDQEIEMCHTFNLGKYIVIEDIEASREAKCELSGLFSSILTEISVTELEVSHA